MSIYMAIGVEKDLKSPRFIDKEAIVHAEVGDRVVVAGAKIGAPVRDGEIVEVHGQNGEPPFVVRWSDTGRESLFFPGPDSHIDHEAPPGEEESGGSRSVSSSTDRPQASERVRNWHVDLYLSESEESTTAHAVLHGASRKEIDSRGDAHLKPGDRNVPEIGDEVAVARALRGLADRLFTAASDDMSAIEGRAVNLEK